jgi:hypothetical protein
MSSRWLKPIPGLTADHRPNPRQAAAPNCELAWSSGGGGAMNRRPRDSRVIEIDCAAGGALPGERRALKIMGLSWADT